MEITKEQAIDLWFKFIESPKVVKEQKPHGHAGYNQFILNLTTYGYPKPILQVILITNGLFQQKEYNYPISESSIRILSTPYGCFGLTIEEATKCRDAWENIEKRNRDIPYDQLIQMLD